MITVCVTSLSSSRDALNSNILDIKAQYKKWNKYHLGLPSKFIHRFILAGFFPFTISIQIYAIFLSVSLCQLKTCDFSHYITRRLFLLSYVSKKKLHLQNSSLSFAVTLWQCTAMRTSCHKATVSANWMVICTGITLCVTDHFWVNSEYTVAFNGERCYTHIFHSLLFLFLLYPPSTYAHLDEINSSQLTDRRF